MKKIVFQNSRGLNLVGNFYTSSSNSVILMCHGFTGDKSENGRFDKTANELNQTDYNVLNFDFSGSGESDDDSLTVDKQVDDLECAIKYVQTKGFNNIGLLGLSLGGLICLEAYNKKIKTMVLWAPFTDKVKYSWDKRYTSEQLEELNDKGYITMIKNKKFREKIIIDKQMLKDRENINQEELLSNVKCPILIIHGNSDNFFAPVEDSKNAMKYLNKDSKLEIITGADHDFTDQLDKFINYSVLWFKKYLLTY